MSEDSPELRSSMVKVRCTDTARNTKCFEKEWSIRYEDSPELRSSMIKVRCTDTARNTKCSEKEWSIRCEDLSELRLSMVEVCCTERSRNTKCSEKEWSMRSKVRIYGGHGSGGFSGSARIFILVRLKGCENRRGWVESQRLPGCADLRGTRMTRFFGYSQMFFYFGGRRLVGRISGRVIVSYEKMCKNAK